eukprot:TRINITY_DN34209_c0_g1_i1.p1 TRINITY_DN34209_c0_g1~~TRINITY_DN34209_c0_g1_i1.p1  ORF type:complete len:630 (+),score=159.58 TRINITY_DN34209_c0_g1_i1:40-1929(+)
MPSQKNKKTGYAAKLEKALGAKSADLQKVLQPYKDMITEQHQNDVSKHPELLRAWVTRMEDELENEDLGALYHLMNTCSCQVYRSFEEDTGVVKESGLVQCLVQCLKKLSKHGLEQPDVLTAVLDIAEAIIYDKNLRSELFLNSVDNLIFIGTHSEHARVNRRLALLIIKAAMQASEEHRAALDVAKLAACLSETDDFSCQSYIVATVIKLFTKEKEKSLKGLNKILVACWGEKWLKTLRSMSQRDLGCTEDFVLAFNKGQQNPQIATLKCKEWQLDDTRFTQETDLLCHCSPSAISFNLPLTDGDQGEVEAVDVPIINITRLNKNKNKDVSIEIKPAKLPPVLVPYSKKPIFTMKIQSEADVGAWVELVCKRTREMRKRKSSKRSSAVPVSEDRKRKEPETISVMSPAKKSTTPGSANIVDLRQKAKTPTSAGQKIEDPSPFSRMNKIVVADDDDMGDSDLDVVFSKLREQFQQNTMKKQQRGKEGLEKTMELVQKLVDDYKEDSSKRNESLNDSVQQLRDEAENVEADFGTCRDREKALAKDIESLHDQFINKAKEHRDNMASFHEELSNISPKINDQEFKALSKLRDMVDAEFAKLEEQVTKIQSQKTMMTRMMKFMMSQLGASED